MIDAGFLRSRWTFPLVATVALVGLTGLPRLRDLDPVAPAVGALLLACSVLWYRSLEIRLQPESLPKLRLGGLAVLVLLMGLLYGLLVAALGLPPTLDAVLDALLLAVVASSLAVALCTLVDVALRTHVRWARGLAWIVGAAFVGYLVYAQLRATGSLNDGPDPGRLIVIISLGVAFLALVAPMEWILELDRRQRLLALLALAASLVPLGVTIGVETLLALPGFTLLSAFTRTGAILAVVLAGILLARATLTLPGARAYERKARELDAIYDFGLTAGSAFNPERLENAVLDAMFRVAEPAVALMVVPESDGEGSSCILQRTDGQGRHRYRFRARSPWSRLMERFADRRPLVIVDHDKAPAGVLERIWEPASGSSVIVPVLGQGEVLRAVLIAGRFESHAFNSREVRSLAGFASQVALALDHARLLRDTVEAERRKRELEIARELQVNLLPSEPPTIPGLDLADRSEPATEVGGDYFDYLRLGNGHIAVVVGDVAGHGMAAGLLMAMAKSAIHTQIQVDGDPANLMDRLSETLLRLSADNQFMTMVFAELDVEGGSLRYANAGHHYPLHFRAGTDVAEQLESTGLPLGLLPRPQGAFRTRPLGKGDILVFYSDGVVEATATDSDEEMFGISRLGSVVLANRERPAETIVDAVFRAVRAFCGAAPLGDDATLVVVRVLANGPDAAARRPAHMPEE